MYLLLGLGFGIWTIACMVLLKREDLIGWGYACVVFIIVPKN